MGNLIRNFGRQIKLGFKTVTFNFKQYFCFFMAILAMQIMFGIIIMSASNNMYQYEKKTMDDCNYHFAMTNLPEDAKKYFIGEKNNMFPQGYDVWEENGFIKVYIDREIFEDGTQYRTYEQFFKDFKTKFVARMNSVNIDNDEIKYEMSDLYNLDAKLNSLRLECAAKLFVLALVSIAVIILLFNIRLNHFKFTYGIYMSFGADTKKLFSTSFWEMMVIGIITLIPGGAIATVVDWYFYTSEDYKYRFAPWLMLFGLIFIIPIFLISVFVPIKFTASKPPLALLLAEDNSNLVSSPRLSTQLMGKKFPGSYEMLGLWRFRRYCATLVASSVLFASVFVWITFFKDIYAFNTEQDQAEFTISTKFEVEKQTTYELPDLEDQAKYEVTNEFRKSRETLYKLPISDPLYMQRVISFEKFYLPENGYVFVRAESGSFPEKITNVYDKDGNSVWDQFNAAASNILKDTFLQDGRLSLVNNSTQNAYTEFEEYFDEERYHLTNMDGYVTKVIKKIAVTKEVEVYGEMLASDRKALENMVSEYGYTYMQCVSDESSTYAYLAFKLKNVRAFSGYEINLKDRSQRVTSNVDYYAFDDEGTILNFIEQNYEVEGDLRKMNEGKDYVVISETAANRKVLDIKPGDTIDIMVRTAETVRSKATTAEDYLADLIREGEQFEKKTFTVAAVIKNMPTGTMLPVYLDAEDFEAVTGNAPRYNKVSVYITPNTSAAEISDLYSEIAEWGADFADIQWNNAIAESREKTEMRNLPVIQMIALFALVLSPLFWFFSQIMFFGKREQEFSMLRGMGATEIEIKRIFRKDGLVYAGLGILATLLFSVIGVVAIHRINMSFVSRFDVEARVLYRFNWGITWENLEGDMVLNELWIAFAAAIILTAICGYMSSMIPYYIDRKKARKTVSKEFGE